MKTISKINVNEDRYHNTDLSLAIENHDIAKLIELLKIASLSLTQTQDTPHLLVTLGFKAFNHELSKYYDMSSEAELRVYYEIKDFLDLTGEDTSPLIIDWEWSIIKVAYDFSDNWTDFSYAKRFLDAIAGVFHIQSNCCAVLKYESKLYFSYNSQITTQNQKRIDLIKNFLIDREAEGSADPDSYTTALLIVHLVFSVDFKNLVKVNRNHIPDLRAKLEDFLQLVQTTEKSIDQRLKGGLVPIPAILQLGAKVVDNYNEILNSLVGNINLTSFFRPKQDVNKVMYFYKNNLNASQISTLEILDNKNTLHAEYNISTHFPKSNLLTSEENYIGVSKLSCGYCHKSLIDDGYNHRGTHGVCDEAWNMATPQEQRFKDSLPSLKNAPAPTEIPQYRTLSTDSFEEEIQDFFQHKELLGLIQ